jgi:hypothetical protein
MRIAAATVLLAALLPQDPVEEAVVLARELRRRAAASQDSEVKLRLEEIARRMGIRAGISLCGEAEDPDHRVLRLHDILNLITPIQDSRSTDFWDWVWREQAALGATFTLDEPREACIGEEFIVDFVKEMTGGDAWQGETTLEKTPNGQLLVNAPPALHRRVARVLQNLHRDSLAGIRLAFTLFASAGPLPLGADERGAIPDEAWERLCRQADEGGAVRRLGSVETVAQPSQTLSAFSGARRPVAFWGPDAPLASTIPDGLAMEAMALPSGDGFTLRSRLSFTKVIRIDEVATAKGTLRLPRFAEAAFADLRTVPAGRPVLLGTLGPLAPEADLPPHVIVVCRASWVRP